MSKEVKRYCLSEFAEPHTYPIGPGAHVLASNYETLKAERDALLAERDAAKTAAERYQLLASTLLADCTGTAMNTQEGALYRALNEIEHVNSTAEIDAIFDAALQGEQP